MHSDIWATWFYRVVLDHNNGSTSLLKYSSLGIQDTTRWEAVTFQTHIKDSIVTSDGSGQQVTAIPDLHR